MRNGKKSSSFFCDISFLTNDFQQLKYNFVYILWDLIFLKLKIANINF